MEANKENLRCPIGKSKIPLPQDPLPPVPKHLTTEYSYRKNQDTDIRRHPLKILESGTEQNIQRCLKTSEPKNAFSRAGPSTEKCVIEKHPIPVPKNLTTEKNKKQETDVRRSPLKMLDSQFDQNDQKCSKTCKLKVALPRAGPSKEKCVINTKYVTFRPKDDYNLDWSLKVFKDNEPNTSDDDSPKDTNEKDIFNDAMIENGNPQLHDIILAGRKIKPHTPANNPSLLEPARVRNLKKSLKRPHSRELQGLSPLAKERKRLEEEKLKSQLSFQNRGKRLSSKLHPPDYITIQLSECLSHQYAPEIFDYLLKFEKKASPTQFITKVTRACVVNWLMKVNSPGSNSAVLQTACSFLDSIFERKSIPVAQLQLIASACFWIGMKLYEPGLKSAKLVKVSDDAFTESELLAAERDVLILLGYPPQPVVPYEFISYLSWVCDSQHHAEIEMTATFFTMCSLLFHTNYCCEQPSVVAAAAMRNACICLEIPPNLSHLADKLENCQLYKKAEAKAINFKRTCSAQRIAVRTVFGPDFEYKAPLTHYWQPPLLAERIVEVAHTFSALDYSITGLQTLKF